MTKQVILQKDMASAQKKEGSIFYAGCWGDGMVASRPKGRAISGDGGKVRIDERNFCHLSQHL